MPVHGHVRTRADHAAETAEDYVEAVADEVARNGTCRVSHLSDRFGVSHVTVIRTLRRLADEGLVLLETRKPVRLTPAGRRLAKRCAARHRLVVKFLEKLGVDATTAATDAEGIEHHLSPTTLKQVERFVAGEPTR